MVKTLKSKLVASVSYKPDLMILTVEIYARGTRIYREVPPSVYEDLISAKSPGIYYTRHIKGCFPSDRKAVPGIRHLFASIMRRRRPASD